MGLIARAIEAAGIPTLTMSSARDITRSVWPPRAAYLDFPLGHTSGRAHRDDLNVSILRDALKAFEQLGEPGSMAHLGYRWADDDDWKDRAFRPSTGGSGSKPDGEYEDDRVARHDTPQYQTDEDESAAHDSHRGEECLVCAGIDY